MGLQEVKCLYGGAHSKLPPVLNIPGGDRGGERKAGAGAFTYLSCCLSLPYLI